MYIPLTTEDLTFADEWTHKVLGNLKKNNIPENAKVIATERSSYDRTYEGTLGEIAVSKAFGFPISQRLYRREEYGTPSAQRGFDVGPLEVRATRYVTGRLILYRHDLPKVPYVLAIVLPTQVRLAGWLYGYEGKVPSFWNAGGRAANCWYVDQANLNPMQSLVELFAKERNQNEAVL